MYTTRWATSPREYGVTVERNVKIPMPDGTRLDAQHRDRRHQRLQRPHGRSYLTPAPARLELRMVPELLGRVQARVRDHVDTLVNLGVVAEIGGKPHDLLALTELRRLHIEEAADL